MMNIKLQISRQNPAVEAFISHSQILHAKPLHLNCISERIWCDIAVSIKLVDNSSHQ